MIDSTTQNAYPAYNAAIDSGQHPRLHMRRDPDDRMAGSIPVWESPIRDNARVSAETRFDTALNYADAGSETGDEFPAATDKVDQEEFSFGDLIDIVNPLHHIPLVSTIYESVTGDTIKPSGRIIGGAVFGGFAGAASGIANVIIEEETGKDVAGNVVAFVTKGDLPQAKPGSLSPEEQLDQAAQLAFNDIESETLPQMALGLQQPAHIQEPPPEVIEYERYIFDDDRMAGTMVRRKSNVSLSPLPRAPLADPVSVSLADIRNQQIEAMTELKLNPLAPSN